MAVPPYDRVDPATIVELAGAAPDGDEIRPVVHGPSITHPARPESVTFRLPLGAAGPGGAGRLTLQELIVVVADGVARLCEPFQQAHTTGSHVPHDDIHAP